MVVFVDVSLTVNLYSGYQIENHILSYLCHMYYPRYWKRNIRKLFERNGKKKKFFPSPLFLFHLYPYKKISASRATHILTMLFLLRLHSQKYTCFCWNCYNKLERCRKTVFLTRSSVLRLRVRCNALHRKLSYLFLFFFYISTFFFLSFFFLTFFLSSIRTTWSSFYLNIAVVKLLMFTPITQRRDVSAVQYNINPPHRCFRKVFRSHL
jgi:hypothetical protein